MVGVGAPNNLQLLDLTPESVNLTDINGDYGKASPFHLLTDDLDTPEREGARPDEEISFFLVTGDGFGHARAKAPQVIDPDEAVDLVLEPRTQEFSEGIPFLVDIKVRPNGQTVGRVHAYVNFDPQSLQVLSIDTGDGTLETTLFSGFDNVAGTLDFGARSLIQAPSQDLVLATVAFNPINPVGSTSIGFNTTAPRQTSAIFLSVSVTRSLAGLDLLRLAQAETSLVEPGVVGPVLFEIGGDTEVDLSVSLAVVVQDLIKTTLDNDNTPTFQWNLPAVLPLSGIQTFEIATGDLTGPPFVDEDFLDFRSAAFDARCFDSGDVEINCDPLDTADSVQLTLLSPLADADYRIGVRIVDGDGNRGPVVQLPFTITLILIFPVTPPALISPAGGIFINDSTPLFDWDPPSQGNPITYQLRATSGDIETGPFDVNAEISDPTTDFQVQSGDFLTDAGYVWQVIVSGDINTASSIVETFTIDTTPPTQPGIPVRFISGDVEDNVSGRFEWTPSEDPPPNTGDASGVDSYTVEIRLVSNSALEAQGVVEHDTCDAVCTFVLLETIVLPGEYRITVEPRDNAGNVGSFSQLVFREGRLDVIQDLHLIDPVINIDGVDAANTPNPQFQWSPPPVLPDTGDLERGGIVRYEVAFTGDFILPFTSYDDQNFFLTECFDATGDRILDSGDRCTTAIDPDDEIRITVLVDIPDGTHKIQVRIITAGDTAGAPVPLPFIVDANAPLPPVSVAPEDQAILEFGEAEARSIDFQWTPSASDDVVLYLLQITSGDIQTGPYDVERTIRDRGATGDTVIMPIRGVFQWRVVAQDPVLNTGSSETRTFTVIDEIVDLRLVPDRDIMRHDTEFTVTIRVEPNGQPVDDVDAFLNYNTADLEVLGIAPGNGALDLVLVSDFDNVAGTVTFSATTIGDPPNGAFDLAQVFLRALKLGENDPLVKTPT